MKKVLLNLLLVVLFAPVIASASLIDIGDGVVYDDTNESYWIQDLSMFNKTTFYDQISKIHALNDLPSWTSELWNDWRMATLGDMETLWTYSADEIVSVFEPSFIHNVEHYRGHFNEVSHSGNPSMYTISHFFSGETYETMEITNGASNIYWGAWVCASATSQTNPVPEPGTMILFGMGCLGFARVLRKKLY